MKKSTFFTLSLLIFIFLLYSFTIKKNKTINIAVITWGGYAGGQYFNNGFEHSKKSRFYKQYGLKVNFIVLDDYISAREAFENNEVDLMWVTTTEFSYESNYLKDAQLVMLSSYSRGGDIIVANEYFFEKENPRICFGELSPGHTFYLEFIENNKDKFKYEPQEVKVASAIEASQAFTSREVDAAIVWSPDDKTCIENVENSQIIADTNDEHYKYLISDALVAKEKFIKKNKRQLKKLLKGWFQGVEEINESDEAKQYAAKILSEGLLMPVDYCYNAINNVHLCDLEDNQIFFGLKTTDDKRQTGKYYYDKYQNKFINLGYEIKEKRNWGNVRGSSIVQSLK